MSYILDALKKSEEERALSPLLSSHDPAFAISSRSAYRWVLPTVIGAAALASTAAVVWWLTSDPPIEAPMPAPPQASAPDDGAKPVESDGAVADLARQTAVSAQTAPAPLPAISAPSVTSAETRAAPRAIEMVKFLRAMPADFQNRVPPLAINIHVFSPDEAQRILYINNREFKRGQEVARGVTLMSITPDGAVLSFEDTRFKLPRPN